MLLHIYLATVDQATYIINYLLETFVLLSRTAVYVFVFALKLHTQSNAYYVCIYV